MGNSSSLRREKWQLESWVDRFAFKCKDTENAFVSESEWFLSYKAFQRLDS
jgi:hypothetical protein